MRSKRKSGSKAFVQKLFDSRNDFGGMAGWVVGSGNPEGTFIIIMGVFGGLFVGFLTAMFLGD